MLLVFKFCGVGTKPDDGATKKLGALAKFKKK